MCSTLCRLVLSLLFSFHGNICIILNWLSTLPSQYRVLLQENWTSTQPAKICVHPNSARIQSQRSVRITRSPSPIMFCLISADNRGMDGLMQGYELLSSVDSRAAMCATVFTGINRDFRALTSTPSIMQREVASKTFGLIFLQHFSSRQKRSDSLGKSEAECGKTNLTQLKWKYNY